MEPITIKGKIEFCEDECKGYDREFSATLQDSGAFAYGNQTAVCIVWGKAANGIVPQPTYLDTRYDRTIKKNEKDFKEWIRAYLSENFAKHVLTIY